MSVVVAFYSRYHEQSLEFVEKLENILSIRKLCVDEKEVRKTITSETKNYNVRKVPSVLVFHPNGFLEKMEGLNECDSWFNDISKSSNPDSNKTILQEEVKPVSKKIPLNEKIPIDSIEFEPRRLDTQPLFDMNPEHLNEQKVGDNLKAEQELQIENSIKKNGTSDSIMSVAQQMQKQREMEVKD
jgi:hypothetical protein